MPVLKAVCARTTAIAQVWNVDTGEKMHELTGHTGGVSAVAVSDDNAYAVTGSWDKTARVWALAVGESLRELKGWVGGIMMTSIVSALWKLPCS